MQHSLLRSDSAVSEVIGNLLIFSIVTTSIGLVFVVGGPVVNSAGDWARLDYIQSTFIILQSDINRVAYNQAPFQNTGLKLGGGSLMQGTDNSITNITVQINGSNVSCSDYIEYTYKGTGIAYINGGVYKKYATGSAQMISAPRIYVLQNMTYISLYHLSGTISRGGMGNVGLSITYGSTQVDTYCPDAGNNLTIVLQGEYADVQGRYLEDQGFINISSDTYSIATDCVTVTQYFVSVED
jgi:hypothetical protein